MSDAFTMGVTMLSGLFCYAGGVGAREDGAKSWEWSLYGLSLGNLYLCLIAGARFFGFIT